MKLRESLLIGLIVAALALTGCAGSLMTGIESSSQQQELRLDSSKLSAQGVTNREAAYPATDEPSYEYIGSVRATSEGLVLLLRPAGLKKASESYNGAAQIAAWTVALYHQIDSEFRPYDDIGFLSAQLTKEIYYHSIAYNIWPNLRNKTNPIKSRFTDYWGNQNQWIWWID